VASGHEPGREPRLPAELPQPLEEAVEQGSKQLLVEMGAGLGSSLQVAKVLKAGQRIQRSLCMALSPDAQRGAGRAGGRHACLLLKQLTDSFWGDYVPPKPLEGLTASGLLARRAQAFQKWCRSRSSLAAEISKSVVSALIHEEKSLLRLQRLKCA